MSLKEDIAQLKEQVEHLEGAIADLGRPTPEPKGNDFARVLEERLQKIDSDEQRAKSRQVAQKVLGEAKRSLEAKERELKGALSEFREHRYALENGATRINQLCVLLQRELEQFAKAASEAKQNWGVVNPGQRPLTQIGGGDVVLPCVMRNGEGFSVQHQQISQFPDKPFNIPQYRYRIN